LKFPELKNCTTSFSRILSISFFLFLILSGLSSSSWAQLTGALCDEGNAYYCPAGQVCLPDPGNDFNGYCCIPGNNCTASSQCGSSNGIDSCGKPCTTATPGTCPASNEPLDYTTCTNNTCVCTPTTCTAYANECGSSLGYDNCSQGCNTATPNTCPTGSTCSLSTYACVYNCPFGALSCGPANSANLPLTDTSLTPDPVNIATGETYFSSTDFSISAQGPVLALFRQYRSFLTFIGMFGYGWRTDFDVNLTQDGSGNVTIYDAQGTQLYFTNNNGTYTPSMGNYNTLIKNYDNSFTLTDKNGIMRDYDATGRLIFIIDRNDNVLSFVYNPSVPGGTYIQDASGRQIVLNIDSNGHVISATDPDGKAFQYGYDGNGNLVSVTDPTGAVTNYTYDSNHKITQFTNANGHNTYYQYDSQGRCVMNYRDSNVNKTTLNYGANNTTVVTDSLGKNNTYVFNSIGLQTSKTDPLGNVTQQTWDNNMNRTSLTDARNNVTNFEYDPEGNLIQITDPLGNETAMAYVDNFNLISSKTDPLGNITNFTYDKNGNLTSVTDALDNTHSFVFDQFGNVITAVDSRGNSNNFIYDIFGHLIQKTNAQGNSTNITYE